MDTLEKAINNINFKDCLVDCKHRFCSLYKFEYKKYHISEWLGVFMNFYKYKTVLEVYDIIDIFKNINEIELVHI